MAAFVRIAAVFGVFSLAACAHWAQHRLAACDARVAAMMASNTAAVRAHDYRGASRTAEKAARLSRQCGDRWRAANTLKVAAELAHQNGDANRARTLLHESVTLMRGLRRTEKWNDVKGTLLAQRLESARKELNGQWAYW